MTESAARRTASANAPREPRAAAGMGVATAASRAVGCARVIVVAAVLGTRFLGNALQAVNTLPNMVFELLAAGALPRCSCPTFVEPLRKATTRGAESAGGVLRVGSAWSC